MRFLTVSSRSRITTPHPRPPPCRTSCSCLCPPQSPRVVLGRVQEHQFRKKQAAAKARSHQQTKRKTSEAADIMLVIISSKQ